MKLPLRSVRLKESTTLCGRPGSVFESKDGLLLTADTEINAVIVERTEDKRAHDAVFVPMSNVAHYTPLAQKPSSGTPKK